MIEERKAIEPLSNQNENVVDEKEKEEVLEENKDFTNIKNSKKKVYKGKK